MNKVPKRQFSIVIEERQFSIEVWIDNKYRKELEKIPGIALVVKDSLYESKYLIKIDKRFNKNDVFDAIAGINAGEPYAVKLVHYYEN